MRHLLAALSLALSTMALPAPAQEAPVQDGATIGVDPGFTASTNAETDLEALLDAIRDGKTNVGAIQSLSAVGEVEVIRVADLSNGDGRAALEKAVAENRADIEALQRVVAGNAALQAKLDANGVAASALVAAKIEADGSLTLYVR